MFRNPGANLCDAGRHSSVWSQMPVGSGISSPSDLEIDGFDFSSLEKLGPEGCVPLEAALRVVAVLISLKSSIDDNMNFLHVFSSIDEFLLNKGWVQGTESSVAFLERSRSVNELAKNEYFDWSDYDGLFEKLSDSSGRPHFSSLPRMGDVASMDDRYWSGFYSSPALGNTSIYVSTINGICKYIKLYISFDDKVREYAWTFISSPFVWKVSRNRYHSNFYRSGSLFINIEDKVDGRDGWQVSLNCLKTDDRVQEFCRKFDIRRASVQLNLEYEHRYI